LGSGLAVYRDLRHYLEVVDVDVDGVLVTWIVVALGIIKPPWFLLPAWAGKHELLGTGLAR
jgi:hypothetical protein